jgi:hypothetical protein
LAGVVTVAEQDGVHSESNVRAAGANVAVFTKSPVVAGGTVPVMVYTSCPPLGISTVSLIFPVPDAAQTAPPEGAQVQPNADRGAGSGSVNVAPLAASGPLLITVTV